MNPAKRRASRSRKDPGDEMVPVIGERIAFLLGQRDMTVAQLARAIGDTDETIRLIVNEETRKCRRRRLEAIARVLKISADEDWLSDPSTSLRFSDTNQSPQLQLVRLAFGKACLRALKRDFAHKVKSDHEWEMLVQSMLNALLNPGGWADRLMIGWDIPPRITKAETEAAAVALAEAFQLILRPWFRGRASLDLQRFIELIGIEGQAAEILNR